MDWEGASEAEDDKTFAPLLFGEKEQAKATDLSNPTGQVGLSRKNKPIPPPLDLSIGATNLSLQSTTAQQPPSAHNHHPYSGSPKFSDKSLPLRKRWHCWSPGPMSNPEESLTPLFSDKGSVLVGLGNDSPLIASPFPFSSPLYRPNSFAQNGFTIPIPAPVPPTSSSGHSNNSNSHNGNNNNAGNGGSNSSLQTPTPFYTPNEPSPKFMNSPIFSYSSPDTSLYQGPFSPMRTSSLYPPPSSPFTNLNLGPSVPVTTAAPAVTSASNNPCFNMIPSTLLSPAPSQASTNSLSYEDLHEKSLSFINPVWSIFMSGTKVRFVSGTMNSMDWYLVDFLSQSGDSLGLKGEYAPHGLEVRTLVVTSSAKERIQMTFWPLGDPHHPAIEVNCEPGHPFMVDKKGWCAVKPEIFFETYGGTHCQPLECGDVCLSLASSRSPSQGQQQPSPQPPTSYSSTPFSSIGTMMANGLGGLSCMNANGHTNTILTSFANSISASSPYHHRVEVKEEKPIPISVVPQTQQQPSPLQQQQQQHQHQQQVTHTPGSKKMHPGPPPVISGGRKQSQQSEQKGRRPMNAFLLFAKDKRPELIQMYPGKDNRSISVLLGEAWQSLAPPQKEKYAASAKAKAEEQKRIHPDCWKRKRSQSTSS